MSTPFVMLGNDDAAACEGDACAVIAVEARPDIEGDDARVFVSQDAEAR